MDAVIAQLQQQSPWLALLIVAAAAAIEYLLPPAPADSVVLGGSLLVLAGLCSFWAVLAAALLGGTIGSLLQLRLGRWIALHPPGEEGWFSRLWPRAARDKTTQLIQRHGLKLLLINRALPGLRGAAFIVAGASGLPAGRALAAGAVSNLAWSALLLGLGVFLGGNFQKIRDALAVYEHATLALAGLAALTYALYRVFAKTRPHP